MRLKILKKLRTASFNSEFSGSYKKSVISKTLAIVWEDVVGLYSNLLTNNS